MDSAPRIGHRTPVQFCLFFGCQSVSTAFRLLLGGCFIGDDGRNYWSVWNQGQRDAVTCELQDALGPEKVNELVEFRFNRAN
jgi:hypothetical protein